MPAPAGNTTDEDEPPGDSVETPKPLPFTPGSAPKDSVESAISFLRLPTWQSRYVNCNANNSEVSCYEIVKAAATLRAWETAPPIGYIWVNIKGQSLPDRMSMLYHGLQIAVSTNRTLYVDRSKFDPFELPRSIQNAQDSMPGQELVTNERFACSDISGRFPKLFFQDVSWPQVFYIHPTLAPWLREHFGYHAAYFMGNYLFGGDKADKKCRVADSVNAVEAFQHHPHHEFMKVSQFGTVIDRCGVQPQNSVFVTNTNESFAGSAKEPVRVDMGSPGSVVCGLRKLMATSRIIFTFGSRFGFWAAALQGRAGGFINPVDNICSNTSNSQQGSLWHTYCPRGHPVCSFRANAKLYVCGPDTREIKAYLGYLLW